MEFKTTQGGKDFSHIKDDYFREKLEKGLVPYEPELWAVAQLSPMEENEVR